MATAGARESSFCDENQNINIVRALQNQKQASTFCDVIMKVCGRDIYAHSNILAAASPYFNTFLSHDLPRQFSQRAPQIIEIQIDGSEPNMLYEEAVSTVIDFIYTGMLTVQESNVAQVSEIARIMQIDSVVKHCEDFANGKFDAEGSATQVKRKGVSDASTNTERSLLVDLMTARPGSRPGEFRSKPPHGKFLSLVSVSTQVAPRLLGLRESEKEMFDKGVGTESRGEESRSVVQQAADTGLFHVVEVQMEKPRRGRKRSQVKFVKEEPPEEDQAPQQTDDINVDTFVPDVGGIQGPCQSNFTGNASATTATETEPAEGDETGDEEKESNFIVQTDVKTKTEENNSANTFLASPRRSSRRAKPKVFDSDFESEGDLFTKRQKVKRGLFRTQEKSIEKPSIKYAEKEAPIATRRSGRSKQQAPAGQDEAMDEDAQQDVPAEQPVLKEESGHSLIDLAVAAAAEVEREKGRERDTDTQEVEMGEEKEGADNEAPIEDYCPQEDGEREHMDRMDPEYEAEEDLGSDEEREDNEDLEEHAIILVKDTKVSLKRPRRRRIKLEREYKQRPGGKFQCDICHEFGTNSVKEFGSHIKRHKIEQNVCYFCDRQFEDRKELTDHMESHKGAAPFQCVHCDAKFKVRTQLNIHLPKHSTEKPFICETCSMGFKWKHALKAHMITHSNRKDHLCDICGYATAHKNQLTAHKRIHTGQTIKCSYPNCNFQATKMQNLKYHIITHTREKPHQCEVCGQAFSLKKNMKRHMLMHSTEIKRTRCAECDFASPRLDKLKEHMLKQHGIGTPPEKRLKVSDLVAQNLSLAMFKPREGQLITHLGQPHEVAEGIDITNTDQKAVERFIIEIENEEATGGAQQVHIAPNQTILVTPVDHELTSQGLSEIAIAVPPVLEGSTDMEGHQGEPLETIVTTATSTECSEVEQFQNVQYAEVMIPPDQMGFVQQVAFVPQ